MLPGNSNGARFRTVFMKGCLASSILFSFFIFSLPRTTFAHASICPRAIARVSHRHLRRPHDLVRCGRPKYDDISCRDGMDHRMEDLARSRTRLLVLILILILILVLTLAAARTSGRSLLVVHAFGPYGVHYLHELACHLDITSAAIFPAAGTCDSIRPKPAMVLRRVVSVVLDR